MASVSFRPLKRERAQFNLIGLLFKIYQSWKIILKQNQLEELTSAQSLGIWMTLGLIPIWVKNHSLCIHHSTGGKGIQSNKVDPLDRAISY